MNYRNLFSKLEETLGQIERSDDAVATLATIVTSIVKNFGEDLGLLAGRLYARANDHFVLQADYPVTRKHRGFRIPVSYEPVQQLLRQGFVFYAPDDPALDPRIEEALGVRTFAAIRFSGTPQQLVAFGLRDSSDRDHVVIMLNTIRHAVNMKLRKQRLEGRVAEVRAIQLSLLPASPPRFAGYDLWGATSPAEEVGGDLFDFIEVSERSLGLAIADSAGHGLPAALQARDAIIGLRMGVEERLRITATIEKLNRVVGRSGLSSRFISLFYGEVEPNGNLVYCNAGHNPPLLWQQGEFCELSRGGLILGPNPDARYERGYVLMAPGSVLLLYTDGIVEAEDDAGSMFGVERLREIVRAGEWSSARKLVERVFAEVRGFSAADPPVDDQTVVGVIRTE
jgi:sigma-B regulation protein RsbU (phosphoserine phosphatase)